MSFITALLTLLNWNVRRTHNHGGDASTSVEEESDQAKSGIELAADRSTEHELSEPLPEVNVYPSVFSDGVVFTDGTDGGWISVESDSYIDMEEL